MCRSRAARASESSPGWSPTGDRGVRWLYEYDAGIDPGDPVVRLAAENALADARSEVGLD